MHFAGLLDVTPDRSGFAGVPEGDLLAAQRAGSEPLEEPTVDDLLAVMRAMDGSLPLGPIVDGDLYPPPSPTACVPGRVGTSHSSWARPTGVRRTGAGEPAAIPRAMTLRRSSSRSG